MDSAIEKITVSPKEHGFVRLGLVEYTFNHNSSVLLIEVEGRKVKYLKDAAARYVFSIFKDEREKPTAEVELLAKICDAAFGVDLKYLCMPTRKIEVLELRQICMWYLKGYTSLVDSRTGLIMGGFNSSDVIHSANFVTNLMNFDAGYKYKVIEFLNAGEILFKG